MAFVHLRRKDIDYSKATYSVTQLTNHLFTFRGICNKINCPVYFNNSPIQCVSSVQSHTTEPLKTMRKNKPNSG